jgi:ubiquinone biosynthesis UbiH/UbiF/VisC/COQ6 family hydroxylase
VLVAGAGLAGRAFALAAARRSPGLKLGLCGFDAPDPAAPEPLDARIYAITPGNAAFLADLGVWDRIEPDRRCAVVGMRVHGDDGGVIAFDAYRSGVPALAWIVEDGRLQRALGEALREDAVVAPLPALERVDAAAALAKAALRGGAGLGARLVVGADGADSAVRAAAGIDVRRDDYGQTAVVANFDCEREHRNLALQWFQGGPVLAFLPLSGRRMSMVWSTHPEHAQRLMAADAASLAAEVEAASGGALGALSVIGGPRAFPLRRQRARRAVAPRVALIGDAAHVVHPLAGQGANLGLQDARVLAELLSERAPSQSPGDLALLRRYERRRAEPTALMQAGVHGLQRLFAAPGRAAALARNRGLNLVNRAPVIKDLLARHAMS